jgi:hypothetical protein
MADPNAQFAIDVAASMPAGDVTIAQLDELTAKLMGGGKNADHFQRAIVQVSTALDAAKAASAAANVALGEGETKYRGLERAALQSAKAAEKAARQNGGVVPHELAARAAEASLAIEHHAAALVGLESDAKKAASAESDLARTFTNVRKLNAHANVSLTDSSQRLSKLRSVIGQTGGPLGKLSQGLLAPVHGFSELSSTMGKTGAASVIAIAGIAAVAVALVALTAAAIAGTIAIAKWAVGLADSARDANLAREALEALHPEIGALRGTIDALAGETGVSTDALSGLAKQLRDAKVSAEDMPDALRAAALAEAALGKGGAADFVADIKAGKRAVGELARETQSKLGGIVEKKMMGLDAQSAKLKKNFAGLFDGLNIEPVLAGMRVLVDMFDEASVTGQTIKFLFETIFQPLINQAERAAYFVEAFALGFMIGMLKLYIAAKPIIKAIAGFFGFDDAALEDTLASVTKVGEFFAFVLAGIVTVLGVLTGVVFVATTAAFAGFVAPFVAAGFAIKKVIDVVGEVIDYIKALDLAALGRDMLTGLARGITGAAGFVIDAIKGTIDGAIKSAKSMLGIASPSKVFMGMGENTGDAYAHGVEATTPDAQSAMANLVSPLSAQDALSGNANAAPAPATSSAAATSSANLAGATFNFYGVQGAEDAESRFSDLLTRILEGDAAQLGSEVPA